MHTRAYVLIALAFMISLVCLSIFMDKPELAFLGFVTVGGLWLLTRLEMVFYVLVASIPWSIEFDIPPFATDLPDEPLMLLTSVSVLLLLIVKRRSVSASMMNSVLLLLIVLQLCWLLLSALNSTDVTVSIKFFLAKCWYLAAFVAAPMIVFRKKEVMVRAAIVLTVSMLLLTMLVMARHYQEGFTFAGINPSLTPFFRNHVNYSALLACILPLLLAFHTGTKRKNIKTLIVFLILFCLVAVYLSYARGAWLAVLVSISGWWLLKKRLLFAAYIVSFLVVFAVVGWLIRDNNYLRFSHDYQTTVFHENFKDHLIATYQFKDVSTAERFYRWVAGVRMIRDNWQTGFGPNTFPDQYKYYAVAPFKTWVSDNEDRSTVHNYFLTMIIEQGVIGLFLLLLLLGYAFYLVQKIYHRTTDPFTKITARTCAMLLCMLCTVNFLSDLVETDKLGSIFYITLAVVITLELRNLRNLSPCPSPK